MTSVQWSILTTIIPSSVEFLLIKHGETTPTSVKPEILVPFHSSEGHVHAYQLAANKDINASTETVTLSQPVTTLTVETDINVFEDFVKRLKMKSTLNQNLNVQQISTVDYTSIVLTKYVKS